MASDVVGARVPQLQAKDHKGLNDSCFENNIFCCEVLTVSLVFEGHTPSNENYSSSPRFCSLLEKSETTRVRPPSTHLGTSLMSGNNKSFSVLFA